VASSGSSASAGSACAQALRSAPSLQRWCGRASNARTSAWRTSGHELSCVKRSIGSRICATPPVSTAAPFPPYRARTTGVWTRSAPSWRAHCSIWRSLTPALSALPGADSASLSSSSRFTSDSMSAGLAVSRSYRKRRSSPARENFR